MRAPDLHAFRSCIAHLVSGTTPAEEPRVTTIVLVPTGGAKRQLARTLGHPSHVVLLTRDELYDWLHARLPGAPPRLTALDCDSLAQAAARAAADLPPVGARAEGEDDHDGEMSVDGEGVPFRLRPGLVSEMLRFYDQLRRQSQRLERFNELIEQTLAGSVGDRGADRLVAQTRFLNATFRHYERLVAQSGAWDEHTLRGQLMLTPLDPPLERIVVTMADWIAEPDGLYIGDFDLLARMPGLLEIDLVCTEQLLGSEFHERLHGWWPGLDEVDAAALVGTTERVRPILEVPRDAGDRLWFTVRDREEELVAVAQHIKAARRRDEAPPLERTAVVFKRPLPYLYLAEGTLAAAGIPFTATDALPLAGEPFVAVVDLVLDAVESGFARESLVALLTTPHLRVGEPRPSARAVRAFDLALRERVYLGEAAQLEALAADWQDATSRPALETALAAVRALSSLLDPAPASQQLRRFISFLSAHANPLDDGDPLSDRERRARTVTFALLEALASAHAVHHDPEWRIEDLAGSVRRWIENETFTEVAEAAGVHLLDDRAARYGAFDDVTIVGLVESEWPERQARNIFYPSGLLKALGWPSEHTRRRAADARFIDLLGSAVRRVAVSTITLDDDAIVMRSMQLDEMSRARLSTMASVDASARITQEDALAAEPVCLPALDAEARRWAEIRMRRAPGHDPRYHGSVEMRAERPWSVSALEAYLACPFKFFAQHILRLEEEPDDSEVMNPRQQGQFVHEVFEEFFAAWTRAGYGAITPALLDEAREVFTAIVETQLTTLPEAEAGLERTRLLGSPAAAGLGEAVMRMEAERPVQVRERLLEARLDGPVTITTAEGPRTIQLKGKADRIDLLEDGTFRLVDYKLGWPPQKARALQLPIYAIAAQQRLREWQGREWELGEAAYLAFKGPKRVVPLFAQPADREKVLADAQQRVADTLEAIAGGAFPPRPEDVFLCESCSFAAVCRKDYVDA